MRIVSPLISAYSSSEVEMLPMLFVLSKPKCIIWNASVNAITTNSIQQYRAPERGISRGNAKATKLWSQTLNRGWCISEQPAAGELRFHPSSAEQPHRIRIR
jgi:hypothetical protein